MKEAGSIIYASRFLYPERYHERQLGLQLSSASYFRSTWHKKRLPDRKDQGAYYLAY